MARKPVHERAAHASDVDAPPLGTDDDVPVDDPNVGPGDDAGPDADVATAPVPVVNDIDGFDGSKQPTVFELNAHHHKVHGAGDHEAAIREAEAAFRKVFARRNRKV